MVLTLSQQRVLNVFNAGENILLLGDPGTGKSTLISAMVKQAKENGLVVEKTASTGIAAQLIRGRTIHSLLKAYPGMKNENIDFDSKASGLEYVDVLIIDEISMIGRKFIDYFYNCLMHVGHPIQVIFVGDFFQLPPVKDNYAFMSPCWNLLNLVPCILDEVIRQKDIDFIKNINMLKYGNDECLGYLLSRSSPTPLAGQISICATRNEAERLNSREIDGLCGAPGIFRADYEGDVSFMDLQVEKSLIIKKGMRVMSIINGPGFSNGSLGTVTDFDNNSVKVLFDNGISVGFSKTCFLVERKDILGTVTELWQIPLRPAYAITIHKSQGQTFQYVNINGARCWAPGQLYVAVSRARSIEGIHFLTPIYKENIRTDPIVVKFYNNLITN